MENTKQKFISQSAGKEPNTEARISLANVNIQPFEEDESDDDQAVNNSSKISSVVQKLSKAMESDHSNSSKRQIDNIDVPPFEFAQANENTGEEQDFSMV